MVNNNKKTNTPKRDSFIKPLNAKFNKNRRHTRYSTKFENLDLKFNIERHFEQIGLKIEDFDKIVYTLNLDPRSTTVKYHKFFEPNIIQLIAPNIRYNLMFLSFDDPTFIFFSIKQVKQPNISIYSIQKIDSKPIVKLISKEQSE